MDTEDLCHHILGKLQATPKPKVKKVALAFSGGLDSSLAIPLIEKTYGAEEVVAILVDVGQGEAEMEKALSVAKQLGVEPIVLSALEEFSTDWLPKAIHANSSYGGYPVSTSMTRQLIARLVAEEAVKQGCDAVMEGSSGKGNDQYRMHHVFKFFAPQLEILVPVRDFDLTRAEEKMLCAHWGVPVDEALEGGDDKTLWARSIASGAIQMNQKIPENVWLWRKVSKQKEHTVTIGFEGGVPFSMNGETMPLYALIDQLNVLAGEAALGLIDICEDGIMGLKSREIYEAPAAAVLLALHKDLESFCLTKEELQFKRGIDQRWAELVYHGLWYHPLKAALDGFISITQAVVSGSYTVKLQGGALEILERDIPGSLLSHEARSLNGSLFDQRCCKDAAKISGLPLEILAGRAAS